MIQTYLFDLYGTLVDIHTDESMPSLWTRMAMFLSMKGAAYGPKELRSAYEDLVAKEKRRQAEKLPLPSRHFAEPEIRHVFRALFALRGIEADANEVEDAAVVFRSLSLRRIGLYPGAKETLQTLRQRGKGVYLLSNAQAAFTMPELHMLGLAPLFDGVVLSSDAGIQKPDRAIFEHILSKYGLRPEACLMIGNDAEADILGAAGAGIGARYIHTKQSPPRLGALPEGCREIGDLRELLRA